MCCVSVRILFLWYILADISMLSVCVCQVFVSLSKLVAITADCCCDNKRQKVCKSSARGQHREGTHPQMLHSLCSEIDEMSTDNDLKRLLSRCHHLL